MDSINLIENTIKVLSLWISYNFCIFTGYTNVQRFQDSRCIPKNDGIILGQSSLTLVIDVKWIISQISLKSEIHVKMILLMQNLY